MAKQGFFEPAELRLKDGRIVAEEHHKNALKEGGSEEDFVAIKTIKRGSITTIPDPNSKYVGKRAYSVTGPGWFPKKGLAESEGEIIGIRDSGIESIGSEYVIFWDTGSNFGNTDRTRQLNFVSKGDKGIGIYLAEDLEKKEIPSKPTVKDTSEWRKQFTPEANIVTYKGYKIVEVTRRSQFGH